MQAVLYPYDVFEGQVLPYLVSDIQLIDISALKFHFCANSTVSLHEMFREVVSKKMQSSNLALNL